MRMSQSKLVQMEVSRDVRIKRLVNEYGPADRDEFLLIMGKIVKKLGGQHFNTAKEKLLQNDIFSVMDILLTYYDKAYLESINKRKDRIQMTIQWDGNETGSFAEELINRIGT